MPTLAEFIEANGITIIATRVDERPGFVPHTEGWNARSPIGMRPTPSKDEEGWEHYAWSVSLNRGTPGVDHQGLHTPYKMGTANVEKTGKRRIFANYGESLPVFAPVAPTAEDVLDCLASDSSIYDNSRNFDDFCADLGYDNDSRKAERLYHTLAEQAKALRMFLGNEAYRVLTEEVERL